MFEQTFKNIDDILYKDSGADSELDYIGQTSWVMFLRYLDNLEQDKADEAGLQGKPHKFIIDEEYRWQVWAMPKTADGKLDHHKAMTGPDLVQFVDHKLFPYLANFKLKNVDNPQTIEYKIGEIFSELKNKIQSGYNLREILEYADELPFRSTNDKHELSHLYESKIKNMGNAGRNGGQYYTPRPLIRAMIEVVQPKIGDRIYDGACGSCGFLCEAYEYLTRDREKLSTTDLKTLQEKTFYGKEKKNLAYIIGVMNMILHGIEAPNIIHTNTLSENIRDIQEKDRYNLILANPPFGGKERPEVQQNFDIKTGETAFLFLQHFIKNLKAGGRAAIVIKNTFLSNSDNGSVSLRKYVLESCNLHTVLDMPAGTFIGAGVKTVVLFFTKGEPTKSIWYYQMDAGRNMGKTNSLNDSDMKEFVTLQKTKPDTEKSWSIKIVDVQTHNYDLSVKNPNTPEEEPLQSPIQLLKQLQTINGEENNLLLTINDLFQSRLNNILSKKVDGWEVKKLKDVCEKASSNISQNQIMEDDGEYPIYGASGLIKKISFYHREKEYIGIVKDGAGIGRIMFLGAKSSVIGTLQYLLPKENVDIRFLFYFLSGVDFIKYKNGSTIPHIYFKDYGEEPIAIPSLKEQQNIVKQLDALAEETKKFEMIFEQKTKGVSDFKKSILQSVFSAELTRTEVTE